MIPGWSQNFTPKSYTNDETLQNFIYKHTIDLETVERNNEKVEGEVTRGQLSSN